MQCNCSTLLAGTVYQPGVPGCLFDLNFVLSRLGFLTVTTRNHDQPSFNISSPFGTYVCAKVRINQHLLLWKHILRSVDAATRPWETRQWRHPQDLVAGRNLGGIASWAVHTPYHAGVGWGSPSSQYAVSCRAERHHIDTLLAASSPLANAPHQTLAPEPLPVPENCLYPESQRGAVEQSPWEISITAHIWRWAMLLES